MISIFRFVRYGAVDPEVVVQELLPGHVWLAPDGHHLLNQILIREHAVAIVILGYVILNYGLGSVFDLFTWTDEGIKYFHRVSGTGAGQPEPKSRLTSTGAPNREGMSHIVGYRCLLSDFG